MSKSYKSHQSVFTGLVILQLVFTASSYATGAASQPTHKAAGELPGERVDIGGHRLYIHCSGSGSPTVVIDAGLGGFSMEWRDVQQSLSANTRVCTYDRAGYGYSDAGPMPRTSGRIAGELKTLLERAHVAAPYVLVGHSFGGYNIRYFASAYPELVSGLVLVDASHPEQFQRFPATQQKPADVAARKPQQASQRLVSRPVMPGNYPVDLRQKAFMLMSTYKARSAQSAEFLDFERSADMVRKLPIPDVPVVVLSRGKRVWPHTERGDVMEKIWDELQDDLEKVSANSLHLIAANSGHSIHLDQPDAVSSAILLTAAASRSDWDDWRRIAARRNDQHSQPLHHGEPMLAIAALP
ncbi:MAG: alpha/beta hydrolase [Gammaproteobacteria bacterium]